MRLVASGKGANKKELFCLDVNFDVVIQALQQAEAEQQHIMVQ